MKILTYGNQEVAPEIRSAPRVQNIAAEETDQALHQTAAAVGQLGQGVDEFQRGLEITRQKAAVADASGAIAAWQNQALDLEHGTADGSGAFTRSDGKKVPFFQLTGTDALAQSVPLVEQLQQKRAQIANGLKTSEARALFLAHTNDLLLNHRRGVEEYVGRQRQVVDEQAANGLSQTAVRTAGSAYSDDKAITDATQSAQDALLASMHGAPEEARQAAVAQLHQDVTAARLDGAIGQKDWTTAERLLQELGDNLGPKRKGYERTVATMKAQVLGQKNAQAAVAFATDAASGLVDLVKLDQARASTPKEAQTPEFEQALSAARAQASQANAALKADTFQQAYTAYEQGGKNLNAVPPQVKTWLVSHDGDGWEKMQEIARRDARPPGGASGASGSPSQIAALNELRYEMAQSPEKFAAMTPAELARQWAPQLSPEGFKEIGKEHAKLISEGQKPGKLAAPVYGSVINTAAHAFGEVNPKSGLARAPASWSPEHHQLLDQVVNELLDRDAAYRMAHAGQAMPPDQLEKLAQAQFVKGRVKGSGWFGTGFRAAEETAIEAAQKGDVLLDENGEPISSGAPSTPATTASREVISYRYNRAKTMRIPVYSDGTQGAPESAQ